VSPKTPQETPKSELVRSKVLFRQQLRRALL
jgi:hypothetical protein